MSAARIRHAGGFTWRVTADEVVGPFDMGGRVVRPDTYLAVPYGPTTTRPADYLALGHDLGWGTAYALGVR